jgi:hypothetical protein
VKIEKKVDYLVNDSDANATTAINELYNSKIDVDHLQKMLSVGILGKKSARRMVPTRWSITAIDDSIAKKLIDKIKFYPEINNMILFNGSYLGNYIWILLLPGEFTFEAIEAWNADDRDEKIVLSEDYETFFGRKSYASNITGGYYAMRLPVCEYLEKIKRQATIFVFRRITSEYYAPLGVGIVRETTRRAMENKPEIIESFEEAISKIKEKTNLTKEQIKEKSWLIKNYGVQKKLRDF